MSNNESVRQQNYNKLYADYIKVRDGLVEYGKIYKNVLAQGDNRLAKEMAAVIASGNTEAQAKLQREIDSRQIVFGTKRSSLQTSGLIKFMKVVEEQAKDPPTAPAPTNQPKPNPTVQN